MSAPFTALLAEVNRVRGVSGSLVVDAADGVIVQSTLPLAMRGGAVAALAASLYRKASRSAEAAGFGAGSSAASVAGAAEMIRSHPSASPCAILIRPLRSRAT